MLGQIEDEAAQANLAQSRRKVGVTNQQRQRGDEFDFSTYAIRVMLNASCTMTLASSACRFRVTNEIASIFRRRSSQAAKQACKLQAGWTDVEVCVQRSGLDRWKLSQLKPSKRSFVRTVH